MGRVIKKQRQLKVFTCLALSVLVCIVLLSQFEVVVANGDVRAPAQGSSDGDKTAPKTLAVLADPVFDADDSRLTGKPPGFTKLNLDRSSVQQVLKNLNCSEFGRLEGTRAEAEAILKFG